MKKLVSVGNVSGSQSPYGAKRFATICGGVFKCPGGLYRSQSPYGAKWFATYREVVYTLDDTLGSQSPYGAKWFATVAYTLDDALGDIF